MSREIVNRTRAWVRAVAAVGVTLLAVLPPTLVGWLTFGNARAKFRVGSRCCRFWGRALCTVLGIRRDVVGRPEGELFAVVANHVSYVDILVLASLYPSVFVAKHEVAGWPLFGRVARNAGTLFVNRERTRDVVRVGRDMKRALAEGCSLTLFPEGTSTSGAQVLPFLPSLLEPMAQSGVPCFSVSLTYETPGSSAPPSETVCWWGDADFVPHVKRLLRIPRIVARVRFAEAPVVSHDRKELAEQLRVQVLDRFEPVRQTPAAAGS
ncbi:MAG: 1-acyl-sn-glycerol-3-phosphate acyltransferase [bacterium]|nr:1-acyl-sn-glycerol-3-phosphate acyltransferase [bacterium]